MCTFSPAASDFGRRRDAVLVGLRLSSLASTEWLPTIKACVPEQWRMALGPACSLPRAAFGAPASAFSSMQRRQRTTVETRLCQDNDTIARLMLVGGVANETGFCYVTDLRKGDLTDPSALGKLWRALDWRG